MKIFHHDIFCILNLLIFFQKTCHLPSKNVNSSLQVPMLRPCAICSGNTTAVPQGVWVGPSRCPCFVNQAPRPDHTALMRRRVTLDVIHHWLLQEERVWGITGGCSGLRRGGENTTRPLFLYRNILSWNIVVSGKNISSLTIPPECQSFQWKFRLKIILPPRKWNSFFQISSTNDLFVAAITAASLTSRYSPNCKGRILHMPLSHLSQAIKHEGAHSNTFPCHENTAHSQLAYLLPSSSKPSHQQRRGNVWPCLYLKTFPHIQKSAAVGLLGYVPLGSHVWHAAQKASSLPDALKPGTWLGLINRCAQVKPHSLASADWGIKLY